MGTENSTTVRVAVTQAEPEWLDLEGTIDKTCRLMKEAADNGAKLIAFPECWIPGYPAWVWSRPVDFELGVSYTKNSLTVDSRQMEIIRSYAAEVQIAVCLGFSENHHNSLYIAQAIIGPGGEMQIHRRKFKPTHMERTVFGEASGNMLRNVVEVEEVGRVGALACWEHLQPLLKYNTILQREQIHVAAWPPIWEHTGGPDLFSMSSQGIRTISSTYAMESQTFVLSSTAVLSQKGIDRMNTSGGALMNSPGGGNSAIYGPDGRQISKDLPPTEEGIIYADLDFDEILKAKGFLDIVGHYSRPDLLWLGVDNREKKHSRSQDDME